MPVTRTFSPPPPVEYGPFDGLLLVDKPAGPTSHDVVHKIRRTFRIEKVGHGILNTFLLAALPTALVATLIQSF